MSEWQRDWTKSFIRNGAVNKHLTLYEKCPNTEFFWSVFSQIRTEYGDLRSKFEKLRIQHLSRSVNNTSIGLPDSGTEWFIIREPGFHCKNPGFSFLGSKPLSSFLGVLPLCWCCTCFRGGFLVGLLSSWSTWLEMCLFLLNSKTGRERLTV